MECDIDNINMGIWAVTGGVVGWLACLVFKPETHLVFLENIAVGIFGALLGGEFLLDQVRTGPKSAGFTMTGLAFALACSVGMLVLLRLMRRSVGPLKDSKSRTRR